VPARVLPPPDPDAYAELAALLGAMSPAELESFAANLATDDRRLVEQVLANAHAMGWRAHPAAMAAHLDPTFRRRRYVDYLSHKLVSSVDGTGRRLIINLPGRVGKTTLLRWFHTWLLDGRPRSQSLFISYGDQLADESAMAVRDNLRRYHGQLRTTLRRDRQQRDRFLTEEGGGLLAAGLAATITGYGATADGVLVVDDPYKSWAEAHSPSRRLWVYNQFRGTLRNRLDDENAGIVVVHHRMHHKDLTDQLVQAAEDETGEEWEVVAMPAVATHNDAMGRAPGETLDPEAFPLDKVRRRALALGSYLTAALEQQQPSPEEGSELLRAWFHLVDRGQAPDSWDQALTSWDLKLKNREAGDYVVGQVWARTGAHYWLLDQLRGQYDHATTANAIALLAVRWPNVTTHVVEAAGSHDEVLPQLRRPVPDYVVGPEMAGRLGMTATEADAVAALRRRGMSGLVPHPVTEGTKQVRARTFIAGPAESGHVHVVVASWTPHWLDELAAFPNGDNDDQVDATSQALQRLTRAPASASAPSGSVAPPKAGASQVPAAARRSTVAVPGRRQLGRAGQRG
jgi:phage terminase large subunit-like protein